MALDNLSSYLVPPPSTPKGKAMPFDATKPVQTREGLPARIIATDRVYSTASHYVGPIIALVTMECGGQPQEYVQNYNLDGSYRGNNPNENKYDLVNVIERQSLFTNVYKNNIAGTLCKSVSECDKYAQTVSGRQATLELHYENDELVAVSVLKTF